MKKTNLQSVLRSSLQKESTDFAAKCRKADSIFTNLEKEPSNASTPQPKKDKPHKKKEPIVRCSVSMTQEDYNNISDIRKRCFKIDIPVSRSEVLRLGIHVLSQASDSQIKKALHQLDRLNNLNT